MDYGMVNAFLACTDLSESENLLRQNIVALNETFKKLVAERNEASESFQKKDQELLKVTGALENQLGVAHQLALNKGLQPVQPPEVADEAQASEDVSGEVAEQPAA